MKAVQGTAFRAALTQIWTYLPQAFALNSPLFFRVRPCIVQRMTRDVHIAHSAGGFALIATRGLLLLTLL